MPTLAEELSKLETLRNQGALTKKEFKAEKALLIQRYGDDAEKPKKEKKHKKKKDSPPSSALSRREDDNDNDKDDDDIDQEEIATSTGPAEDQPSAPMYSPAQGHIDLLPGGIASPLGIKQISTESEQFAGLGSRGLSEINVSEVVVPPASNREKLREVFFKSLGAQLAEKLSAKDRTRVMFEEVDVLCKENNTHVVFKSNEQWKLSGGADARKWTSPIFAAVLSAVRETLIEMTPFPPQFSIEMPGHQISSEVLDLLESIVEYSKWLPNWSKIVSIDISMYTARKKGKGKIDPTEASKRILNLRAAATTDKWKFVSAVAEEDEECGEQDGEVDSEEEDSAVNDSDNQEEHGEEDGITGQVDEYRRSRQRSSEAFGVNESLEAGSEQEGRISGEEEERNQDSSFFTQHQPTAFDEWMADHGKTLRNWVIALVCLGIFLAIILIPTSFERIEPNQMGLPYDTITKELGTEAMDEGNYFEGVSGKFILFPTTQLTEKVKLECLTTDGITAVVELEVAYSVKREDLRSIVDEWHDLKSYRQYLGFLFVTRSMYECSRFSVDQFWLTRIAVQQGFEAVILEELVTQPVALQSLQFVDVKLPNEVERLLEETTQAEQDVQNSLVERNKAVLDSELRLNLTRIEAKLTLLDAERAVEKVRTDSEAEVLQERAKLIVYANTFSNVSSALGVDGAYFVSQYLPRMVFRQSLDSYKVVQLNKLG